MRWPTSSTVQVGQDDLTERLVATSRQYGIEPQQLFGYLQENNQLPAMFADVRRGLAIGAAVEAATVTDTDGNTIDTSEFFGKRGQAGEDEDSADADFEDDDFDAETRTSRMTTTTSKTMQTSKTRLPTKPRNELAKCLAK